MHIQKLSVKTVVTTGPWSEPVGPNAARGRVQQKGEAVSQRVQRAKMLTRILGTAEVQDRRGQEVGRDADCNNKMLL